LQGSAAADLRQGGKLYDRFFCPSSQNEQVKMKELFKLECLVMPSMMAACWMGRNSGPIFLPLWTICGPKSTTNLKGGIVICEAIF